MLSPLVLCGPSGSGKSTLLKRLMQRYPRKFGFSVSHTTRAPRPGEEAGRHYHFVSVQQLRALANSDELIEQAEFSGNLYATSKQAVMDVLNRNKICILDIDVQGVKTLKSLFDNEDKPQWPRPKFVFVRPPSLDTLEQRLRDRGTETDETINKRLASASREIAYGEECGNFDVVITNDDLDKAFEDLHEFVRKAYNFK